MKYNKVKCPICGTYDNSVEMYPKNFKDSDLNTKIFSARRLPDRIHYRIVKCLTCGLVRSDPVTDIKKLNKLYEKSIFTYDSEVENLKKTYLDAVNPILRRLPKKARILEIGCGNGFLLDAIYSHGFKNVLGIEPSLDAKNKASSKIKPLIKTGIFDSKSFKKLKFDFIFMFQTLDHIPDPNSFMKNIRSSLKNDGYFLAFNHNVSSLSAWLLGEKSPIIDIEHTFLYDHNSIKSLFEKHGLRIERIYSPYNYLSLGHLIHLLPLPKRLKIKIASSKNKLLSLTLIINLGNLCIIGQNCELD